MAKIINQGNLTTTETELTTVSDNEIVIIKMSNFDMCEITIKKNGEIIDKCVLSESSTGVANERQLEINTIAGDVITAFASRNEFVSFKIIV